MAEGKSFAGFGRIAVVGLLAVVLTLCGVAYYFWSAHRTKIQRLKEAEEAFAKVSGTLNKITTYKPKTKAWVDGMKEVSMLVVRQHDITAEVTVANQKEIWIINMGKTTVRIRARENRVQYYVPLGGLSEKDFEFDSQRRQLTVSLPRPRLDKRLVKVQTDPKKMEVCKDIGWGRFEVQSGRFQEDQARSMLEEAVIEEASKDVHLLAAQETGRAELERLIQKISNAIGDPVAVKIRFRK